MMCIYIKGGLDESSKFLKALKVFALAESLGGFESLIEHPALTLRKKKKVKINVKRNLHKKILPK